MDEPSPDAAAGIPALGLLLRLSDPDGMPVEALEEARRSWDTALSLCLTLMDHYARDPAIGPNAVGALFFLIHLCGELREARAYRPLMRFLSIDPDRLEEVLGDALTETVPKVTVSVFDGDPEPMQAVILDESADDFVRSGLLEALAFLTGQGRIARERTVAFLRDCEAALHPRSDSHVWYGWQSAIVHLGIVELADHARQAFRDGRIDPAVMDLDDFERDWKERSAVGEGAPAYTFSDVAYFGNTVDELSWRFGFSERGRKYDEDDDELDDFRRLEDEPPGVPAFNLYRDVGRNDPCPCGSGKKFKKCCLGKM